MNKLIILIGNIGSGKSTYSKKLAKEGYIILSRDAIRYMCGAGEYLYDVEVEPTIRDGFNNLVASFMNNQHDIVIDETNMSKYFRKHYLTLAKDFSYETTAIVMPKLSKSNSIARRLQFNHGNNTKEVWMAVWDKFDSMYDIPTKKEGFNNIIYLK